MTELDPVIHVPARLRILVALAQLQVGDTLSFARLQGLLDLTAGNLITHLRRLDEAGYVSITKTGRATTVELSDSGRAAFAQYRRTLQTLLGGDP
jgi:DNA-binding MarR family transcriptional regulator